MKSNLSKLINVYSAGTHSGVLTSTLLIADDLSGQGYKVLLVIKEPGKLKKAIANFDEVTYLSNSSNNMLSELYMLLDADKMTDERLVKYSKKLGERDFHLVGPVNNDYKELTENLFPFTATYDFVFYVSNETLSIADINIQMITQDALMTRVDLSNAFMDELVIIGQYKEYKHLSIKKIKRWLGRKNIYKVSQSEDVNRAYYKDELLLKNNSVDKEIDLITKQIIKEAVIR